MEKRVSAAGSAEEQEGRKEGREGKGGGGSYCLGNGIGSHDDARNAGCRTLAANVAALRSGNFFGTWRPRVKSFSNQFRARVLIARDLRASLNVNNYEANRRPWNTVFPTRSRLLLLLLL